MTVVVGGRDPESAFGLGVLLLVSCSLVTGTLVAAAFLLPSTVGALISGAALLGLGVTFLGSVLTLLAALPDRAGSGEPVGDAADSRRHHVPLRDRLADRLRETREEVDAPVFLTGVAVATVVIAGFLAVPVRTTGAVAALENVVFEAGREVLLVSVLAFVAAAIVLAAGPWGRIRLGGESATPEFSTPVYVAMLFSAGIAAGIVFWGPAEALLHYETVPRFLDAAPR